MENLAELHRSLMDDVIPIAGYGPDGMPHPRLMVATPQGAVLAWEGPGVVDHERAWLVADGTALAVAAWVLTDALITERERTRALSAMVWALADLVREITDLDGIGDISARLREKKAAR